MPMNESEQRQFSALEADNRTQGERIARLEARLEAFERWKEHEFLPWKKEVDTQQGKSAVHLGRLLLFMSVAASIALIVGGMAVKALLEGSAG